MTRNPPSDRDAPATHGLPAFDLAALIELDVRDELRAGGQPLARILAATDQLPPGAVLHVRTPFEPVPLYHKLVQRGFLFHRESFAADDWSSWFWRGDSPPSAVTPSTLKPPALSPIPEGVMDLRALPAPEPLVAILAQMARSSKPFEVMLPFDPPVLDAIVTAQGWRATRVAATPDGAHFRLSRVLRGT